MGFLFFSREPRIERIIELMAMHPVTIEGFGTFEIEEGTKLVKAIEASGFDISHRCGGNARCTTCNVKFLGDEPAMGETERACLEEDGEMGNFRLSCQVRVNGPLHVQVLTRASEKGWEPGAEVED